MAPASEGELRVRGIRKEWSGTALMLVLAEPLTGHSTFLSAVLVLDGTPEPYTIEVRIHTFDDVTVLSPLPGQDLPTSAGGDDFSGTLLLPHGWRAPLVPDDFAQAALEAGIDTDRWSEPEARQLLTFLGEARPGSRVRAERIDAIICALAGEL